MTIACASNLKNLGLCASYYCDDNQGVYPPRYEVFGNRSWFFWSMLGCYIDPQRKYYYPGTVNDGRMHSGTLLQCPSNKYGTANTGKYSGLAEGNYAYNGEVGPHSQRGLPLRAGQRISTSTVALFSDGGPTSDATSVANYVSAGVMEPTLTYPNYFYVGYGVHQNGLNILFLDQHVKKINNKTVKKELWERH